MYEFGWQKSLAAKHGRPSDYIVEGGGGLDKFLRRPVYTRYHMAVYLLRTATIDAIDSRPDNAIRF